MRIQPLKIIISNKLLKWMIQTPWCKRYSSLYREFMPAVGFKVRKGADSLETDDGGHGDKAAGKDTRWST